MFNANYRACSAVFFFCLINIYKPSYFSLSAENGRQVIKIEKQECVAEARTPERRGMSPFSVACLRKTILNILNRSLHFQEVYKSCSKLLSTLANLVGYFALPK